MIKREFKHKKELGQNFINNENIINRIVDDANITKKDLVIEIGPGMGVLSKRIVPLSRFTILYEIDKRLENKLMNILFGNNNYKLIIKDFLKANINDDIKMFDYQNIKVVANLPYYITSPIINKLISEIYPDEIIIMIQKEVADRFCAKCKNREYGYITVYLNSYYNVIKLFDVDRSNFDPMPNVDSTVIKLVKKDSHIKNREVFNKLIKDSFKFKRKNLKNNLKFYDLVEIEKILKKYGYGLNSRAEEISLELFIEISDKIVC